MNEAPTLRESVIRRHMGLGITVRAREAEDGDLIVAIDGYSGRDAEELDSQGVLDLLSVAVAAMKQEFSDLDYGAIAEQFA